MPLNARLKNTSTEVFLHLGHVFLIIAMYVASSFLENFYAFSILFSVFFLFLFCVTQLRNTGLVHLDLTFLAFLFIYSFSVPLSNAISYKEYSQSSIDAAVDICFLAYLGYSLGLTLDSTKPRRLAVLTKLDQTDAEAIQRAGFLLFGVGLIASVTAIAFTTGLNTYLTAGYAGRALLKRESGPVELGLYISVIGLFAVYTATLLSNKARSLSRLFVASVFIVFFLYISFLGIRRPLFLLALGLVAGSSLVRHRPTLKFALPIALIAFAFLTTFAKYRQLISSDGISDAVNFVEDNVSSDWLDVSDTELGAPFRSLIDYMGDRTLSADWLFGSSYLQTLAYILPSSLTGGMESLAVKYTNDFFPSDFIAIGGNMGLFPVTEAYLNFGSLGTLVLFFLYGFSLSRANRWFHGVVRCQSTYVVLFMVLVPWAAFFMRLDMASFAKGFLYSQLLPLLLLIAIKKKHLLGVRGIRNA